jgi:hypothetical protein
MDIEEIKEVEEVKEMKLETRNSKFGKQSRKRRV